MTLPGMILRRQGSSLSAANAGEVAKAVRIGQPRLARKRVAIEDPSVITLRIGTLRERSALSPKLQIGCESSFGWVRDLDAIAGIARQP
jgi:hypothetical protein